MKKCLPRIVADRHMVSEEHVNEVVDEQESSEQVRHWRGGAGVVDGVVSVVDGALVIVDWPVVVVDGAVVVVDWEVIVVVGAVAVVA